MRVKRLKKRARKKLQAKVKELKRNRRAVSEVVADSTVVFVGEMIDLVHRIKVIDQALDEAKTKLSGKRKRRVLSPDM